MSRGALLGLVLVAGCMRLNPEFDGGASEASTASGAASSTEPSTGATTDAPTGSDSSGPTVGSTSDCMTCACSPGAVEKCYDGPPGTQGVGTCQLGGHVCEDNGAWSICEGAVKPAPDVCGNGLDEDCNGAADDDPTCGVDPECPAVAGLVACYPFPVGVVDALVDGSGHGHHGAMSGVTLTSGVMGHGQAATFGPGSVATVAEFSELNPESFTVATLLRPQIDGTMAGVVDKEGQFGLFLTGLVLECVVVNEAKESVGVTASMPSEVWSFVACSFNGAEVTLSRYTGGSPEVVADDLDGVLEPNGDSKGMRIGNDAPGGGSPYQGELDWVLFFDRALMASELCALAGQLCA